MRLSRRTGRRLARLATGAVVRHPRAWLLFRPLVRSMFDALAARWDDIVGPGHLEPLLAALEGVQAPARALDVGAGTGAAAFAVARLYPGAQVIGVDLAPAMVEAAAAKIPSDLDGRVRFLVADASELPLPDGSCQLVTLANMIPFPAELARVLAPGGAAVVAFSHGAATPIHVPLARLRERLAAHGFSEFAEFAAGGGVALRAERAEIVYGSNH